MSTPTIPAAINQPASPVSPSTEVAQAAKLVLQLTDDPVLANELLFKHRHPDDSAPYHPRLMRALNSHYPRVAIKMFRGSAKSTTAEEVMSTLSAFKQIKFGLIIGETYDKACMRLASIKHELGFNKKLLTLFGGLEGSKWGADEVILANGVMLKAMGRGQSTRGLKSIEDNSRPDFALLDDLEDKDSVRTAEGRHACWEWVTRELEPALEPGARVRWLGTPLHVDCAFEKACASTDWKVLEVPIYFDNGDGTFRSNWPGRFPDAAVKALRDKFERDGDLAGFSQEYLCRCIDSLSRTFHADQIQVVPQPSSFMPRTLIVDPARTRHATSSLTGYAVTSWMGSQLIVHEAFGRHHSPSEQVGTIFEMSDRFSPGTVAVEKDGLEEWLMQPLRAEITRRGTALPLQPVKAPGNKLDFIKGLQPFFAAREVVFAKDLPELREELLNFPYGKLDIVNALAYAIRLRPGAPVYPGFTQQHVAHFVVNRQRASMWLALNATPGLLAAVLVALQDGGIHVIHDWVREGPLADTLQALSMDINALAQDLPRPQIILPQERCQLTDAAGLGAALQRYRMAYRQGKRTVECIESLTEPLRTVRATGRLLTVSPEAPWTLNALGGGYARDATGTSLVMTPQDNVHRVVAQALECLAGSLGEQTLGEQDDTGMAVSERTGRSFRSLLR